ncbi:MAG: ADP-ribosylglycohydrolase family protein [Synergistaceae bacterium]|jgi:ADP-ribosylglycohydrolase|nr:ADP-ribosylglycohydrolase family protein [Synergistaceae bacterium]
MLGAIIGDIIGSPYERHNIKTVDFPLFSGRSRFTDDTVLTAALAEGLMDGFGDEVKTEACVKSSMLKFGRRYPKAGYGSHFKRWLLSPDAETCDSFGNGAAMRVSPAGWIFSDLEATEKYAAISARVSHGHPEGIKGASSVAGAIFLARTAKDKAVIKKYVEGKYGYDLSRRIDDIRPVYAFDSSCQGSVPEAIIAFLESDGFEDTIRKAVSIGGDSDTIAAIAGSVAEAFWGIPEDIKHESLERLDTVILSVIERWEIFLYGLRRDKFNN